MSTINSGLNPGTNPNRPSTYVKTDENFSFDGTSFSSLGVYIVNAEENGRTCPIAGSINLTSVRHFGYFGTIAGERRELEYAIFTRKQNITLDLTIGVRTDEELQALRECFEDDEDERDDDPTKPKYFTDFPFANGMTYRQTAIAIVNGVRGCLYKDEPILFSCDSGGSIYVIPTGMIELTGDADTFLTANISLTAMTPYWGTGGSAGTGGSMGISGASGILGGSNMSAFSIVNEGEPFLLNGPDIYPTVEITPMSSTFSIVNTTCVNGCFDGCRDITTFTNCTGEPIRMKGRQVVSDSGYVLLDCVDKTHMPNKKEIAGMWNGKPIAIHTGTNNFDVIGDAEVKVDYRLPILGSPLFNDFDYSVLLNN